MRYSLGFVLLASLFTTSVLGFLGRLGYAFRTLGMAEASKYPVAGSEDIMSQKAHGTSDKPVQKKLRWGCDVKNADKICNFNRHYAEYAGYWTKTSFLAEQEPKGDEEITFYDSVTGVPLFIAPRGRSFAEFKKESEKHGWPSFRDEEVVWDSVRVLKDGEVHRA